MEETLGRMHTPKDASQTHILVFPTSATAHANQPSKTDNENIDMDIFGEDGGNFPGKLCLRSRIRVFLARCASILYMGKFLRV